MYYILTDRCTYVCSHKSNYLLLHARNTFVNVNKHIVQYMPLTKVHFL